MNIIKLENVNKVNTFNHKLEIKSNYRHDETSTIMVILSEEDVNNDNCVIKLRGYIVKILILPKKYKFTFNDTKTYKAIINNLSDNFIISYY